MKLQVVLNAYATETFRKQADYDYIAARSNYRMELRQQFLWSAQQAIEKYLKAILLFNGKSARFFIPPGSTKKREFHHDLDALLHEIKTIPIFEFEIEADGEKFLSFLSSQGGKNRYVGTSAFSPIEALQRLDRLVWHIRRYCQYVPGGGYNCPANEQSLQVATVRAITDPSKKEKPHFFAIIGGEIEKVIKRNPKDPARMALIWANMWYGKKNRRKVKHKSFSSWEVPPNERPWWQGVDWDAVKEYVKL